MKILKILLPLLALQSFAVGEKEKLKIKQSGNTLVVQSFKTNQTTNELTLNLDQLKMQIALADELSKKSVIFGPFNLMPGAIKNPKEKEPLSLKESELKVINLAHRINQLINYLAKEKEMLIENQANQDELCSEIDAAIVKLIIRIHQPGALRENAPIESTHFELGLNINTASRISSQEEFELLLLQHKAAYGFNLEIDKNIKDYNLKLERIVNPILWAPLSIYLTK